MRALPVLTLAKERAINKAIMIVCCQVCRMSACCCCGERCSGENEIVE